MTTLDSLVEIFTWVSWVVYGLLLIIGLPGMYRSIDVFITDEDMGLALFAFVLPIFFCLGWGMVVYYAPLLSGFMMIYFILHTLRGD